MAERRIVNGWIYEKGADGQIRPIGPAQQQAPVDPTFATKGPQAQASLGQTQANTTGQNLDNRITSATLPDVVRKTKAEADAAEIAARAAAAKFAQGPELTPQQAEAQAKAGKLNALVAQINRTQQLFNRDIAPEPLGWLSSLGDYLPSDGNARFDVAGASLSQQGLSAFRTPGTGTVSDRDAIMFDRANLPSASTRDAAIEEQLRGLRSRVDEEYGALGRNTPNWAGLPQPAQQRDAASALIQGGQGGTGGGGGGFSPVVPGGGGMSEMQQTGGATFSTANDVAYAAALQDAYNKGADVKGMLAVASRFGFKPELQDVASWQRAVDYREGTGEYKGGQRGLAQVAPPSSGRRNLAEQALGSFAGSNVGAAGIAAADAGTFGLTDEIVGAVSAAAGGNYQAERDYANYGKNAALQSASPWATGLGTVAGGMGGGMALEQGLAHTLPRLLNPATLAAVQRTLGGVGGGILDGALYGSAYGAGSGNDNRLSGMFKGAVAGAGGGAIGSGATSLGGAVIGGVGDAAARRLAGGGVTLTPGQLFAQSGWLGRSLKKAEDAAESLPGLGSIIRSRREDSFRDVNRRAFNDGLAPINEAVGNIGEAGIEDALDASGRGYQRALGGVNLTPDYPFAQDIGNAVNTGRSVPGQYGQDFNTILTGEIQPIVNGSQTLNGQQLQDLLRVSQGYGRQYRHVADTGANGIPQPAARPVAGAFDDMTNAIEGLTQRQAPDVMPAYRNANEAYRNVSVLRDAVDAAKVGTQSGEGGVFTPAQLSNAARKNAKRYGGTHGTTDQPFFQLTRDAQDVLPSNLPNSGTYDRAISAGILSAPILGSAIGAQQGWLDPETALAVAAASALYSRPGAMASTAALTRRPQAMRNAGQFITNQARRGGLFGAGLMLPAIP